MLYRGMSSWRLDTKKKQQKTLQTVWMEKEHKTSYKAVNGFHLLMLWLVSIAY